ncbi:MAG: fatty acid desaturase [Alphaproteobacteria bacterium]|nr:fatty acid desaturase [Alphaproteobacteria bacterium]
MTPYDFQMPLESKDNSGLCMNSILEHCRSYQGADIKRSIIQLVTTLALFAAILLVMVYFMASYYLLTVALMPIAAGLLTRIFIFQHDCGHGCFFKTKKANARIGRALSMLTFTPYDFWRRAHNMHHATSGDLDRRSIGGIDTITVSEYEALPSRKKSIYRLYRNPFFLIILGTPVYTMLGQRLPFNAPTNFYEGYKTLSAASIRDSIMLTNLLLIAFYSSAWLLFGLEALLWVYLPVLVMTTWIGGWLFYVQHQFEDTYWEKNPNWNIHESALMGSSYYKLPKILQWFTGNIGLHHIHHLCSQIPNYKLQECMDAMPELAEINVLTLKESFKCGGLKLWDEDQGKMVTF